MTNYEKYKDWFEEHKMELLSGNVFGVDKETGEPCMCHDRDWCHWCNFKCINGDAVPDHMEWLTAEYKEPEIDWSKVPVDTKILVRDLESTGWLKRHFARYDGRKVWAWDRGATSFSAGNEGNVLAWNYARLWKEGE